MVKSIRISVVTMFLSLVMAMPVMADSFFQEQLRLAEQGNANAQCAVAKMYFLGDGVRQDKRKAFEWSTKAAEQGHAIAQGILGFMYYNGEGVRQDKRTAKEWYGKACDNGDENGCKGYKELNEQGY